MDERFNIPRPLRGTLGQSLSHTSLNFACPTGLVLTIMGRRWRRICNIEEHFGYAGLQKRQVQMGYALRGLLHLLKWSYRWVAWLFLMGCSSECQRCWLLTPLLQTLLSCEMEDDVLMVSQKTTLSFPTESEELGNHVFYHWPGTLQLALLDVTKRAQFLCEGRNPVGSQSQEFKRRPYFL